MGADGTPPLAYQWRFNGNGIAGENATALALTSLTTNQAGCYSVVVSSALGSVTSQVAVLSVILPAQPDLSVQRDFDANYEGGGTYSTNGAGQTKTVRVDLNESATYYVQLINAGDTASSFWLRGSAGTNGWLVQYFNALLGGLDITSLMTGSGTNLTLAPKAGWQLRLEVTPGAAVLRGASNEVWITPCRRAVR